VMRSLQTDVRFQFPVPVRWQRGTLSIDPG
jgi:hypothetical protein